MSKEERKFILEMTAPELEALINVVGFDCQRTRAELGKEPHIDIKTAYDKLKNSKAQENKNQNERQTYTTAV